jgi:ABC-type phosphate transport system substrate-binding protein
MRHLRAFSLALLFLAGPLCHARDLAVIVNKNNTTTKLSAAELEQLLKAAVQTWPDGKKVRIFLTDPRSADSRQILQRAYKLKPDEIKALADSHKAEIEVVGSDEIVLTMVDQHPGAVGIINVYSINSHVKVLKVDDKLPMEQGYLLHGN